MLRQRVLTAVAMAAAFLGGVLFLSIPTLALTFVLVVALGAWEWAPLAGLESALARAAFVLLVVLGCGALYLNLSLGDSPRRVDVQPLLGVACLWWCFALLWVRSFPGSAVLWSSRPMRVVMGLMVLLPAWMAAVYLLSFQRGGVLMATLVLLVATADIGAYFIGKRFGRHKLAPAVSPAKTWEGFWGGMIAVVLVTLIIWSTLPAQFDHIGMVAAIAVGLATALTSVLGDLTVSMVKRESGVKDSSSLLPGHGGLLDRLDSLCGAAPTFALALLLAGY
ncbi:MAG: phosphatidate cytidylyltransferase [Chromatocurvus sp.]